MLIGGQISQSLEVTPAYPVLISTDVMKGLSEYTRLFIVYMSFAVFLAAEAAAIFFMYRHLGIL